MEPDELRRLAAKVGHPAGDIPAAMHAAAAEIERMREHSVVLAETARQVERERWKKLADELRNDMKEPRHGLHGNSVVDDDYFLALEYVVRRMDALTPNYPHEPAP